MRFWFGLAAAGALSACSGTNPFLDDGGTTEPPPGGEAGIPEAVASDLDSFVYTPNVADPANSTLTVSGVTFDGTPFTTNYVRNARLDSGDYQAFTSQNSPLDAHSTAFVRDINGTRGAIVVTGGQFGYYNGGGSYARQGEFSRPTGVASGENTKYVGTYVGLLNYPDDGSDLLPAPGADPSVRPSQAGRVTGDARIVADFSNNRVKGRVFNREYVAPGTPLSDLDIAPTDIQADGTFSGKITQSQQEKGDYGGLFGGPQSEAVAGALYVKDHIQGFTNPEEYGLFVLDKE